MCLGCFLHEEEYEKGFMQEWICKSLVRYVHFDVHI